MKMAGNQKLLTIVVSESDRWGDQPLYEAITRKLAALHAPGATVQRGIMGFGVQKRLHHKQLFGIWDDRPVSIWMVHEEGELRETIVPALQPMVRNGLMFLSDVEVVSA